MEIYYSRSFSSRSPHPASLPLTISNIMMQQQPISSSNKRETYSPSTKINMAAIVGVLSSSKGFNQPRYKNSPKKQQIILNEDIAGHLTPKLAFPLTKENDRKFSVVETQLQQLHSPIKKEVKFSPRLGNYPHLRLQNITPLRKRDEGQNTDPIVELNQN